MELGVTLTVGGEGGTAVTVGPAGWTEFTVGRGEDANLFLNHATVSRRHCRLLRRGSQVLVEDLGSRLGTFVGARRVEGTVLLADGDDLRVGEVLVAVAIVDPEAVARARRRPSRRSRRRRAAPRRPCRARRARSRRPPPSRRPSRRRRARDPAAQDRLRRGRRSRRCPRTARSSRRGRGDRDLGPRRPRGEDARRPRTGATSDVVLDNPVVSHAHAELRREGEGFVVADLGSTNGTFVNGVRVTAPRPRRGRRAVRGPLRLEVRRATARHGRAARRHAHRGPRHRQAGQRPGHGQAALPPEGRVADDPAQGVRGAPGRFRLRQVDVHGHRERTPARHGGPGPLRRREPLQPVRPLQARDRLRPPGADLPRRAPGRRRAPLCEPPAPARRHDRRRDRDAHRPRARDRSGSSRRRARSSSTSRAARRSASPSPWSCSRSRRSSSSTRRRAASTSAPRRR